MIIQTLRGPYGNCKKDNKHMKKEKKVRNDKLFKKVTAMMELDEIFQDSNLTVEKVAQRLKISNRHLSSLIHIYKRMNFNSFVNEFRVEKAKQMMVQPEFENYTLIAIGKEVGFNSKTTYIHAFKKFSGVTPSLYKKELTCSEDDEEKEPIRDFLV